VDSTVKTWWSSRLRPRDRGSALRLIAPAAVGVVLFLLGASHPAAAAGDELRVIAVHTASAPRVSMVVEPPATQPDDRSTEAFSVTVDEDSVATTATPMASGDLSVALVIDTASDMTAEELAAVQSGATEFLLRLPEGAHTMVVAAGGEPQIVAPLSEHAAEALSAISALRTGGSANSKTGTRLAAQSLQSAPPGPHVIIVYARGPGEQDPSVEQLSAAVLEANAVVDVIPTGAESVWPWVVDRTGGVVLPPTGAADIVQSYGRLATMLSEQYLVTFQAPDELPAVAEVVFQSGDQEYRTVVNLPDTDTKQAAPTEGRGIARLVPLVVAGLIVLAVVALVLRTRRRASVASSPLAAAAPPQSSEQPVEGVPPQSSTAPAPVLAMPATEEEDGVLSSNGAPSSTVATAATTSPPQPPSRRGSLSAAVQGRRSAQLALNSALEQQIRHTTEDQQQRAAPEAKQAKQSKGAARPQAETTSAESQTSTRPSGVAPTILEPAATEEQQSVPERHDMKTVLTGSGDAVVEVTKTAPGPAVVHISGNSASEYFAVRTLGTNNVLVMTSEPYDGIRPLDWDGDESTGFEILATGPWRIEMLPLSAIPTFTGSFNGNGNMVVHFTGAGSLARITGNNERQHFEVRALTAYGPYRRLVDTTRPHADECQISRAPQIFEVQATGSWTITIK
jgi:hypothetical protein